LNTNDNFTIEKNLVQMLLNRGVDGLIIALSNESFSLPDQQAEFLEAIDRPFVLVDRNVPMQAVNQVYFDHQIGGKLATECLLAAGHRHIALMTGALPLPGTLAKIRGYQQAMSAYKLPIAENYLIETGYRFNDGLVQTSKLLALKELTAVIAANDMVAFGVMKELKKVGYQIPQTISLVGYDHLEIAEVLDITLTTVEQNTPQLASEAVTLLKKLLAQPLSAPQTIVLTPTLFMGQSIKKLN